MPSGPTHPRTAERPPSLSPPPRTAEPAAELVARDPHDRRPAVRAERGMGGAEEVPRDRGHGLRVQGLAGAHRGVAGAGRRPPTIRPLARPVGRPPLLR